MEPKRQHLLDVELVRAVRRVTGSAQRAADYVEALESFAERLESLPLPVQCDVDTAQAFRDAAREEIVLNGVRFVGDHRTEAFVAAVKRIVGAHVGGDAHPERALLLADRVMRGCSRTLSGADSFFAVHELFASPELLVSHVQLSCEPPGVLNAIPSRACLSLTCSAGFCVSALHACAGNACSARPCTAMARLSPEGPPPFRWT